MKPNNKKGRTHSENLSCVCYACFNKTTKGVKITDKIGVTLKGVDPSFVRGVDDRPNVLCVNCRFKLANQTIVCIDYKALKIKLRRNEKKCSCAICEVASQKVGKTISPFLASIAIPKKPNGRPTSQSHPSVIKICTNCNNEIHRGVRHKCNKRSKITNTILLSEGMQQQIAAKIVSDHAKKYGSSSISIKNTRGSNMQLAIKRKRDKSLSNNVPVPSNVLNEIQLDCNMPMNAMKKLCKNLRSVNKNIIQPNALNDLQSDTHMLDDFFTTRILTTVAVTKYSENGYPFVYCNNFAGLVSYLVNKRSLENFHVKIGVDSGQKSLKICLSLMSKSRNNEPTNAKNAGIRKLMIIGLGVNMTETYENLKTLFDIINLQSVCGVCDYTFAADLKLLMIILGLQSSSCMHPCPYCTVLKSLLSERGSTRTIGNISEWCEKWKLETDSDLAKAKNYFNSVNIPIITGNENTSVLKYIPPPELHLMIGIVKHIFTYLEKDYPDISEKWLKGAMVQQDHQQQFNGNNARRLLKKIDILEHHSPGNKYISVFKSFNYVVSSCFGQKLDPSFNTTIQNFVKAINDAGIRFTPKLHILAHHVPEFCSKTQMALGYFSEQASESVHHSFNEHGKKFNLNPHSKNYSTNLHRAVCVFNSQRV